MISYLSDKIHTNYIPTPAESQFLRQELSGPNQKLANMEDEICKVEGHLQELNQQRDILENKITGYRGMLSPARRLLPEILQEIFIRCLPVGNSVMSSLEAPLLLGRVCRQWRNIAYSTPILWSSIHISVPSDSQIFQTRICGHASRTQAIEEWLSRAGICPLSISICGPSSAYGVNAPAHDSTVGLYVDAVSSFLTRCHSFYFSCTSDGTWKYFLRKCAILKFPSLKHIHLDISMDNWDNLEGFGDLLNASPLFSSPKLYEISLSSYGSRTLQLPLQWNQLVVLNFYDKPIVWDPRQALSVSSALLLLSWCPHLAFCSIPVSENGPSYHSGQTERVSTIVTLPALVGFSVRCDSDPKPFFVHLSTPCLRYFQYHQEMPQSPDAHMNGEDRALHSSLGPFIRRIIQPIEELQILITYLTARDVTRCLELFPELKRLSLLGHGSPYGFSFPIGGPQAVDRMLPISDSILKQFIQTTSRDNDSVSGSTEDSDDLSEQETGDYLCLCPKLEMLDMRGASFQDTRMLSFIRSRMLPNSCSRSGVSRIRWLSIHFPAGRAADPEIQKEIEKLKVQTGAHMDISYGGAWLPYRRGQAYSSSAGLVLANEDGTQAPLYLPFFGPMLLNDGVPI